ncbi:MAG: tetratricopeptide repeat protein [Tahibacter sp.]
MNTHFVAPRVYWQQPGETPLWQVVLAATVTMLVPLLLYLPTLRYGFIYDDVLLVAHNESIRSLAASLGYFQQDFDAYTRGWEGTQSNYYRPLVFVFMATLWPWTGDDPARWHAVVLLLNALVSGLAFAILRTHGLSLRRALFGTLLFSLHPLHVHSVAWITGLHDVLAAVFTLLGYLCLARWLALNEAPQTRAPYPALAGFALAFIAGLLVKESTAALAVLALLLAAWSAYLRPDLRVRASLMAGTATVVVAAYLVLRWNVLGALATPFPSAPAWPEALASVAPLCWAYVFAWIWPVDLSLFSPFRPLASLDGVAWLISWAAALVIVGLAIVLVRRQRFWLFPLLLAACLIAPYLNLRALNPEWALMHRYLYLPSLGLAWMVALLPIPTSARGATTVLATSLLVLLGVGSAHDMRAYRNEQAFWDKAVEKDPGSSAAWTEQGRLLLERGDPTAANNALQRAVSIDPSSLLPRLRLGNLQFSRRDFRAAAATYQEIIARSPDYPPAWRNLPSALLAAGNRDAALSAGREALERFPQDPDVLSDVGTVRKLAGDLAGALSAFTELAKLKPNNATICLRLASLQAEAGRVAEARQSLAKLQGLTRDASVLAAAAQLSAQLPPQP